jgi:FdhE protein
MHNHKQYFNDRTKRLLDAGILDSNMIDFYTALYEYQYREFERYQNSPRLLSLGAGEPPVVAVRNKLSTEGIMDLIAPGFDKLVDIMAHYHPGLALQQLRQSILPEPGAGRALIEALLDKNFGIIEQHALQNKTGAEEAVFILINWLKPFFTGMREHNRELIPVNISGTDCPFCGYYPEMAAINPEENGKRYLYCSLCEHRWPYKRIACSVCGTEEADKLEFFSLEGEDKYRIDACNKCGGYIKTVRLDKFEDIDRVDMTVENIITPHLDGAALQKGYRRP